MKINFILLVFLLLNILLYSASINYYKMNCPICFNYIFLMFYYSKSPKERLSFDDYFILFCLIIANKAFENFYLYYL